MDSRLFDCMLDVVHVDEKWFYLTQTNKKFYLAPGEAEPHRTAKSKRFVPKVMFLCATARPRWDTTRNVYFDGKIGMWPFTKRVGAQRSSRNRPRGTMVTVPINVTAEVYREFILNKVLPAIDEKWPECHRGMTINIQQDNARPHIAPNDPAFLAAVEGMNMNVRLVCQPPNSPDLNVLDLGYFNAIQSLQQTKRCKTIDELVKVVNDSFLELHPELLNKVFLTLQTVMELIILNDGGNNFKIPHMRKDALARQGQLPISIDVSEELMAKLVSLDEGDDAVAEQEAVVEMEAEAVVDLDAEVETAFI
jgi:hypothetical protein